MLVVKTVKLKLFKPTVVKQRLLSLLKENHRLLGDYASLIEEQGTLNKSVLHKLSYNRFRSSFQLPSGVVQTARDKAVEAFKGYRAKGVLGGRLAGLVLATGFQ